MSLILSRSYTQFSEVSTSDPSARPFPKLAIFQYMKQSRLQFDAIGPALELILTPGEMAQYRDLLHATSHATAIAGLIKIYPATIQTVCSDGSWRQKPGYLPGLVERFQKNVDHIIHQHIDIIDKGIAIYEKLDKSPQPRAHIIAWKLRDAIDAYDTSLEFWGEVQISTSRMHGNVTQLKHLGSSIWGASDRDVALSLINIESESGTVMKQIKGKKTNGGSAYFGL